MQRLTNEDIIRFSRHIVLPEVGGQGQLRLKKSRVIVVGAGGLGSPVLWYLGAAGIGNLTIVDNDVVSLSNLQRQIIHATQDLGNPKVDSAAEKLRALNPHLRVTPIRSTFTIDNCEKLIRGHDFLVECSDNFATKYLVNDTCVKMGIPFSIAGVLRHDGQVMTVIPGDTACYRCVFPQPPPLGLAPEPAEYGLLGVVPGIIGTIQAAEALKYLLGISPLLTNRLLLVSVDAMTFDSITFCRRTECQSCGRVPEALKAPKTPPQDSVHGEPPPPSLKGTLDASLQPVSSKTMPSPSKDLLISGKKLEPPLPLVYVKLSLETMMPGEVLLVRGVSAILAQKIANSISAQKLGSPIGLVGDGALQGSLLLRRGSLQQQKTRNH